MKNVTLQLANETAHGELGGPEVRGHSLAHVPTALAYWHSHGD